MNIMFADRQFLSVHWIDADTTLAERLTISNQQRQFPYKLWFLDDRTERKYRPSDKKVSAKSMWSFYIPEKHCPLNYRQLAVWFVLWSIKQQRSPKDSLFTQSLSGIEKLVGLGKRQAYLIATQLEEKKLIKFDTNGRQTWFYLHPYTVEHQKWFRSTHQIPQKLSDYVASLENQEPTRVIEKHIESEPKPKELPQYGPEETLIMLNLKIPDQVKHWYGFDGAKEWWERNVAKWGTVAEYRTEDEVAIRDAYDKLASMNQVTQDNERHDNEQSEHIEPEPDDDFVERLKRM